MDTNCDQIHLLAQVAVARARAAAAAQDEARRLQRELLTATDAVKTCEQEFVQARDDLTAFVQSASLPGYCSACNTTFRYFSAGTAATIEAVCWAMCPGCAKRVAVRSSRQ